MSVVSFDWTYLCLSDIDAWDIEMLKVPKSMPCFSASCWIFMDILAISASKNSSMIQWGE